MARRSSSNADPLGDLLESLQQDPIRGLFPSSSSSSLTENSVVLYDWWLVKPNEEGESKSLAISGFIAKKVMETPFTSAPIVNRHDTFTLEAADGVIVKVEGMINQTNTQKNGFSDEVCQQFSIGFPFLWKQCIGSCVDNTTTPDTSALKFPEQVTNDPVDTSNVNQEAADPIGINDEKLGDPLGCMTKEFEPAQEGNQGSSDNNMRAEAVVDLEREDTASLEKEDAASLEKEDTAKLEEEDTVKPEEEDTVIKKAPDGPRRGRSKNQKQNMGKRSADTSLLTPGKKDHVLQTTPTTTGRRSRRINTEAHGATISLSSTESNIRRTRSGRAIIPAIDKGSQKVLYDQNGNFVGIAAAASLSEGSTLKSGRKKRRF